MADPSIKDLAYRGLAAALGGPVDIATMIMRPFGYKTPDAQVVGGSEWIGQKMQDVGIVSSARNPLGEFAASMIVPGPDDLARAAAFAPALIGSVRGIGSVGDVAKATPSAIRQINTINDLMQNPSKFPKDYIDIPRKEIEIPTGLLRATQKDVDLATVSKYVRGKGSFQGSPSEVVFNKQTGEYLITDGHHRAASEVLKGNKTIKVELVGEI